MTGSKHRKHRQNSLRGGGGGGGGVGGGGAEREIQPPCNASGRNLLETCTAFSLRHLNGRIVGDLEGKRTCFHDNGSSVVDYLLGSKSILRNVRYLIVNH